MAVHNRVFYPVHQINLGGYNTGAAGAPRASGFAVSGVQSVSLTTNFNTEPVFQLGQLAIYELIESLPEVELSIERVLDGTALAFELATSGAANGSTLLSKTNYRCHAFLSIFPDSLTSSTGAPSVQTFMSGMYVSSIAYNLPVDGNFTESITLVGNDKINSYEDDVDTSWPAFVGSFSGNDDVPPTGGDGVLRRQNVNMGEVEATSSLWPSIIPGIKPIDTHASETSLSGHNAVWNGAPGAKIQDISISTNLNRTDLFTLGLRAPYYKYAEFPTAVDCSMTVSPSTSGVTATTIDAHNSPGDGIEADSSLETNLSDYTIWIRLSDDTSFNLGKKNRLSSVTYSGGDTGGGVVNVTYNFQNFNDLTITSPSSPWQYA